MNGDYKPVDVPGFGVVEFPSHMTDGEIQAKLADLTQQNRSTFGKIVGGATEMLGKSVLPTLGAGVGALAGPGGMVGGAMLGEAGNQALGISSPSMQDVVTSGVMAGGGQVAGKALGGVVRRLPGAPGILHGMAAENLMAKPGALAPAQSSENLYAVVSQFNPSIRADKLRAAAQGLTTTEAGLSSGLANDEIRNVGKGLVDLIDQHSGNVPFQTLRAEARRLGDRAGSLSAPGSTGGETKGAYKLLFRELQSDLETAASAGNPAMPAVQALKEANAARKVEFVVDDLKELFSIQGGGLTPRPDGAGVQVNFGTIIRKLEKDPSIRTTLGDDAYKSMIDDLNAMWKRTPAMGAVPGVDAGSKNVLTRTGITSGLGGLAGGYFFNNPGMGAAAGAVAGSAGPLIIGKLVATKMGRSVLKGMLEGNGGVLSPQAISVLGTAVGMSDPGRAVTGGVVDFGRGALGQ